MRVRGERARGQATHISKCVKKSTSSLVVNGTNAPTVPSIPPYTTASVPPACKAARCTDVTTSPQ